jgi:hypothetical protein
MGYWGTPEVATLKGKIYYWKRQIANGRTDSKAEEMLLQYSGMLEAIKAAQPPRAKKGKKPPVPQWQPPADMTVHFT